MKIVFNRKEISEAVAPLMCAVSGKSTQASIDGILIEAQEDQTCVMTTFDTEKGMRITVKAEVEEAGTYIINAQKFVQTLRVMEGDFVTLTVDANLQACISSGKSNHKMNALAGDTYPAIPRLVTSDGFVIGQAVLKSMLAKVMYAMASNDQRPVLNGCYFRVTEGNLLMVSCDSFKLAKCSIQTDIENKNEDGSSLKFSFIIPTKTVNELFKLLKDDERENVRIYMTRKNIVFNIGDLIFFSRLIDGVYIDFDRIILNTHKITAVANREVMIAALERAALVTEEKVAGSVRSHVKLLFEGDLLKISAVSTMGSTYDEVDVDHAGEDLLIAFNNRFLIDSLRASDAEKVKISMTSALTSINIEPETTEENKEELFMLLPVRMKE
ncbi:MAG: DNA polymerase III subunit beta [Clostridia bacterium]|nr:DNA polymerase III subunit beta [Clostridia bacterium]